MNRSSCVSAILPPQKSASVDLGMLLVMRRWPGFKPRCVAGGRQAGQSPRERIFLQEMVSNSRVKDDRSER